MSFSSELTLINELGTFPVIQKEGRKILGYGFCLFVCLFYFRDSLVGFILGISFFFGGELFCLFIYRIFQNYIFAFTWIEIFISFKWLIHADVRQKSNQYCKVKVAQSSPTLCDPMGYTVHGILKARILEWVVFASAVRAN